MNKLLKEHQVGDWCKRAAWFFVAIGVIDIVIDISSVTQQLATYPSGSVTGSVVLVQILSAVLSAITNPIFYFFVLYAAGTVVNRFIAYTEGKDTNGKVGGVTLAWREGMGIKPTTADTMEKTGNVTRDKVEDTASKSSVAEAAEEESDVTLAEEDAVGKSSVAEATEEGSDVTLAEEEDTATKSTTESNGKKSDVRLARRRRPRR